MSLEKLERGVVVKSKEFIYNSIESLLSRSVVLLPMSDVLLVFCKKLTQIKSEKLSECFDQQLLTSKMCLAYDSLTHYQTTKFQTGPNWNKLQTFGSTFKVKNKCQIQWKTLWEKEKLFVFHSDIYIWCIKMWHSVVMGQFFTKGQNFTPVQTQRIL